MKTVVGLFDERGEAQRVYDDLTKHGFTKRDISLITTGTTGLDSSTGIPQRDLTLYQNGVQHGGALVVAKVDDTQANTAADIMSRYKMVDIAARMTQPSDRRTSTPVSSGDDQVLSVIEEELNVGKRTVESGRTHVYTTVTETPIEEQVTLHQEHINVERHPVNRNVTSADMANAFKEQSFDMREMREEAVVSKTARVVEEVVIGKQATDHTETIRDTVRRTDVSVEDVPRSGVVSNATTTRTASASSTGNVRDFASFNNDYHTYYNANLKNSGYTYDQLSSVYQYGYDLANDSRYHGKAWSTFETDARSSWEQRNPGTWDQFKDTVRYAWDTARGTR